MRQKTVIKKLLKSVTEVYYKVRLLQSVTMGDTYGKVKRNTSTCKDSLANSSYANEQLLHKQLSISCYTLSII